MQESFLHFIWRQQYFDKSNLHSTSGETINIIYPGYGNDNSGPDFNEATIEIDSIQWAGSVEIHIKASDWKAHKHQLDHAYDNVILHVVWDNDAPIQRADGSSIPTIELKQRVDRELLVKSDELLQKPTEIPCGDLLNSIQNITVVSAYDRALSQRLERKADEITKLFLKTNNDWEETAYRLLAKNFGFKINAQPFEELARAVPFKIIKKHATSLLQIEALLFGQAGFLETITTEYQQELEYEYRFLEHKYDLNKGNKEVSVWKFGRIRPANFPTLRIAQLAALLAATPNLFSVLIGQTNFKSFEKLLSSSPSKYWEAHYHFGDKAAAKEARIGKSSKEIIAINTVAPLMVAYGKYLGQQEIVDRAIGLLESIRPEDNKITRLFSNLGRPASSAFDSQAQLELYTDFCSRKKCLSCAIGNELIKTERSYT